MPGPSTPPTSNDKRLGREAAAWFARMRGPMADASRADFEAWMQLDGRRAAYERLEARWRQSAVLGRSSLAHQRLGRGGRAPPRARAWPWGAVAGCLAAAVGVALLVPLAGLDLSALDPTAKRLSTGVGEIRTVRLQDGETVILDTDSVLSAGGASGGRWLRLVRGRVRFDLASKTSGAFTVEAGAARVRSARSVFDLSLTPSGGVDVALIDGAIAIAGAGGADRTPSLAPAALARGQAVDIARDQTRGPIHPISPLSRDWPSGLITVEDAPLQAVLDEANRYGGRKIRLGDDRLGRLLVSGVFRASATRSLADSLAAAFKLQVTQTPSGDLLLSQPDI